MTRSQVRELVFIGILGLLDNIGKYWYVFVFPFRKPNEQTVKTIK